MKSLHVSSKTESYSIAHALPQHISDWIPTSTLASLAGIEDRAARKAVRLALNGKPWRGVSMEAQIKGGRLEVYAPSLPADLRDIWHERYKTSQPAAVPENLTLPSTDQYSAKIANDYALMRWRMALIAPALQFPKFSKERGAAVRETAKAAVTKPNGKAWKPTVSTIETWIALFENGGEQALRPKSRNETTPRVQISRAWDSACPLDAEQKTAIAESLATRVKSLWVEGAPGWKRVNQLASVELLAQCRAAGWQGATLKDCQPGRPFVEKFRKFSLVAIKNKNAKVFFDKYTPRIQRKRDGIRPGDIIVGDVHPMDVVRKIDNRMVHARLISWLDVATYDIFVTAVVLPPNGGIRREDVARSFVDMVQAWGLPRQLRLDRGQEFKDPALIKGFEMLAGLVTDYSVLRLSLLNPGEISDYIDGESFNPVSRSRPYNAPAKQIEHTFGIVEYSFFSMMPGWIGGDRMNKRTQLVGQDPKAYEGADKEFVRDVEICLNLYRNTPQKDGSSPNQKWEKAIAGGYKAVHVGRNDLIYAFSEREKLTVRTGGVKYRDEWYYADCLIPLIGHRLEFLTAKWEPEAIFYVDSAGAFHAVPAALPYGQQDGSGAKEQSRRNGLALLNVRQLKAQTEAVDLLIEAARVNAEMPPAPIIPFGPSITTTEGETIGNALKSMAMPAPVKLLPGQLQHPTEGHIIEMQPCNEEGAKPTAIDFDPLRFALPAPETQKPNPEEPDFDLIKALAEKHDENRRDETC